MDINELKGTVLRRFQELTDTEQSIFENLGDTVVGEVILKLIGPELNEVFSEPEDETERMLAERTVGEPLNRLPPDEDIPDLAKDMPEEFRERPMLMDDPQRDTMPQAFGRGDARSQGGNELPPMRARDPMEDRKGEREMASR